MRMLALALLCLLVAWSTACAPSRLEQSPYTQGADVRSAVDGKKKVLILLIDSLLSGSLDALAAKGQVPAFSFLIRHGQYKRDLISSFPTMSVTIDSTLLTGTYPDEHGVPGLLWYHPKERRIINYGDGLRAVWKPGLNVWLYDSLWQLNHAHLSRNVRTLHEELHARGYTSASVNALIYRGSVPHNLTYPSLLQITLRTGLPARVYGPDLLGLGTLSKVSPLALPDRPFQSYGFTDAYTTQSLVQLIRTGRLPDVTLAYFPDMDGELHRHGPEHLAGIARIDGQLRKILDAFGDWRRALDQCVILVLGDSGVTSMRPTAREGVIDLERLLDGYRIARLGRPVQPGDEVAIAVNGTMSYLYPLSDRVPSFAVVNRLAADSRIDVLAWREGDEIRVLRPGRGLSLTYRPGGSETDVFGQRWTLRGDWRALDLTRDPHTGRISSRTYPDGLRRLAAALSHAPGVVAACARSGAEFLADGNPIHPGGGNHGSLHRSDSLVPLIVATNGNVPPPPPRYVDLKAYILSLLPGRR